MPFKEIKITEHSQNYHLVDFANDKYKELTEIIHQTEDSGIWFSSILLWIEANKEQIIQNCDTC